jgi:hypothetical protein
MKQRISLKLVRAWLVRHILFKARDDVALQHLHGGREACSPRALVKKTACIP